MNLRILLQFILFFCLSLSTEKALSSCGTGIKLAREDDGTSIHSGPSGQTVSVCRGAANHYILSVEGTVSSSSTVIFGTLPAGIRSVSSLNSTLIFYVESNASNNITLEVTVSNSGTCNEVYTLILNPNAITPSIDLTAPSFGCDSEFLDWTATMNGCVDASSNSVPCMATWNVNGSASSGTPPAIFEGSSQTKTYSPELTATASPFKVMLTIAHSSSGCKARDESSLDVKPNPYINNFSALDICVNNRATLSFNPAVANTLGATSVEYKWDIEKNGTPVTGAEETVPPVSSGSTAYSWESSNNLSIPGNDYTGHVEIKAIYSGGVCQKSFSTANFSVNPLPIFTASVNEPKICLGEEVALNHDFSSSDITPNGATWSLPSGSNNTSSDGKLVYAPTQIGVNQVHILEIKDKTTGCTGTSSVTVTVEDTVELSLALYETDGTTMIGNVGMASLCSGIPGILRATGTGEAVNVDPSGGTPGCSSFNVNRCDHEDDPAHWIWSEKTRFLNCASIGDNNQVSCSFGGGAGQRIYNLTYINTNSCKSNAKLVIDVQDPPPLNIDAPSKVCGGDTIILEARKGGSGPKWASSNIVGKWQVGDNLTNLSDINSSAGINPLFMPMSNVTGANTTKIYSVTVSNGACETTENHTLTVSPNLVVSLPSFSAALCLGQSVEVEAAVVGGSGVYSYSWEVPPSASPNANNRYELNSPGVGFYDFKVSVTDNNNCETIDSIDLEVEDCGRTIIEATANGDPVVSNRVCKGDSVILRARLINTSGRFYRGIKYLWDDGQTTSKISFIVDNSTPDTINYSVVAGYERNFINSVGDQEVQFVRIGSAPSLQLIVSKPDLVTSPDTIVCEKELYPLTVECPDCAINLDYSWKNINDTVIFYNLGNRSNGPITLTSSELSRSTSYEVMVKDAYNCKSIDTVLVEVKPLPNTTIAQGDTISYCPKEAVFLSTSTLYCDRCTYLWSTGQTSPSITVNRDLTYFVTTTNNGCTESDTIVVDKHPLTVPVITTVAQPIVSLSDKVAPDNIIYMCDQSLQLAVDSSTCIGCSYSWSDNFTTDSIITINNQGGIYVEAIDSNGCLGVSGPVLIINSTDGLNATPTATPSVICDNDTSFISVPPCIGCSYIWYNTASPLNTLDTTRIYTATTAGDYYVKINNAQGCIYGSSIVNIQDVGSIAVPTISASSDTICSNPASFTTLSTPSDSSHMSYLWYVDGIPITGATTDSLVTNQTGVYEVLVTYDNGCSRYSNSIEVVDSMFNPIINTPTSAQICQGSFIELSTQSYIGASYQWYLNGMPISSSARGSKYYASQTGQYNVVVTNAWGCTRETEGVDLTEISTTVTPDAYPEISEICPNDTAILSVSLCAGCFYQWFNASTGIEICSLNVNNYSVPVTNGGNYYAKVVKDQCSAISDTITVSSLPVIVPAINTNTTTVCDGVTPVLFTSSCVGCTYNWHLNNSPIFGALNDTLLTISNVSDAGRYYLEVTYPNGCTETSNIIDITDGSYTLTISSSDSLVCNGDNQLITSTASSPATCNLGCNYQWFRTSLPITSANDNDFTANAGGLYRLEMIDSRGCTELSNIIPITEINLTPTITTNATSICGPGTAELSYPDSSTCIGCTYTWQERGSPATYGIINTPYYQTDTGVNAIGTYILEVNQLGCVALSNQIALNQIAGLDIPVAATNSNLCNGDTVTIYRTLGDCTGCLFQWLIDGNTILAATTPSLVVNSVPGDYSLEMTVFDTVTGNVVCVDTSAIIVLDTVPTPIISFDLAGAGITPLSATGSVVSLYDAINPVTIRSSNIDSFYSQPFNAVLGTNSGLGTADNSEFDPTISGSGYHRIFYQYDTLGCSFIVDDIMYVFDDPSIDIVNENFTAPSYEACVSDTLLVNVTNLPFYVDSVYLFDENNNYVTVQIDTNALASDTFGIDIVYNGYIRFKVPSWAQASFMKVTSANNQDTFTTPFIRIHNENLAISGLPSVVCSNGDSIELTGTPLGGYFTANYTGPAGGSTKPDGDPITNAFSGNQFLPTAMPGDSYDSTQIQQIDVVYNYENRFTNGQLCPLTDTAKLRIQANAVFLDSIGFNRISISQERELLTNLVLRAKPITAKPSQWRSIDSIEFSGNFTFPAGAPEYFLPANAGIGKHPMTYIIKNGTCQNSVTDSIKVIDAPMPIGIPDSMCRTQTFSNFGRDRGLYKDTARITRSGILDSLEHIENIMIVSTTLDTGLTVINSLRGSEEFNYSPLAFSGNHDMLKVEYWNRIIENIGNGPSDTLEYIVGSIVIPIYIEDTFDVQIIDSIVSDVYCEEDQLSLLAGSPNGGIFTLQGGTAAYATTDTLVNNLINPFDVHDPEDTTVEYTLTYIRQGAVCQNQDSKIITIPEPLDPSFAPAGGSNFYCASDPEDTIVINTTGLFTSEWLINGVAQVPNNYTFNPPMLNPGKQIVTNLVTDTVYGCVYKAVDTFVVYPLPEPRVIPELSLEYCTNDPIDTFLVTPTPICAQNVAGGLVMLSESFDLLSFPTSGWGYENGSLNNGGDWVRTTVAPFSGLGAAYMGTTNVAEDAWLFTPTMNLTTGHTYRISFFAQAGTCLPPPCDPASMHISLAQGQSIADHTAPSAIAVADTSFNQPFYNSYSFDYTHTGATGSYNFGLQMNSTPKARSLTMDDLEIQDLSLSGCIAGGTGNVNGPGINYLADSTYTFDPTVVAPGTYNYTYIYTDAPTGCVDSVVMPVTIKPHPLPTFNNLAPEYCDNAPSVPLIGVPSGGIFTSTGPNLDTSSHWVFDPNVGTPEEIISYIYTDPTTHCTTKVSDTVLVITITDSVTISTLDTSGYCESADSIVLDVTDVFGGAASPGLFFGAGVRPDSMGPGAAIFYPDSAVLDSSRYGEFYITYIYPTSSGCIDTTRAIATVHANPRLSFDDHVADSIRLPDSICLNAGIVQIRVNNFFIEGDQGQIQYNSLLGIGPVNGGRFTPLLGLQDTLRASSFGLGWHNIEYHYVNVHGCSDSLIDSFRVDSFPDVYFRNLQPDRIYCENEAPSLVLGYPPYYPGSGYLQITSGTTDSIVVDSSFYMIDPAVMVDTNVTTKQYHVYYEYTDLNGCTNYNTDSFDVRPYPRIDLSAVPPSFCSDTILENLNQYVTPVGGMFTDNLVITGIYQDTFLNLAGPSGPRRIEYGYLDTATTCFNKEATDVTIYNTPELDFYALGGCEGATVTFIADTNVTNLVAGVDSIVSVEWIFGDMHKDTVYPNNPITIPDHTHAYSDEGLYTVMMAVNNRNGCIDTVSNFLTISPYINQYPYTADFQTGDDGWSQEEDVVVPDSIAIWQRAELLGDSINDLGNYAWVTKSDSPYTYTEGERAWVYSPCFNLTDAWRPMIVLDIWRDFLTDIDGTVMEYYDYNTNTWERLGEKDKGIAWYQTRFLVARPGNQADAQFPQGWTGESRGWENARYRLDQFIGQNFVRFRMAFASDLNTVLEGNEGMAFDNVWIGERTRNVLVEHFSNYHHTNSAAWNMDRINQLVYDTIFNTTNGRDISLIQYATPKVGIGTQDDPLIVNNQVDFADNFARVGYYGISENSKMRIDGTPRNSGNSEDISQWELDYDMLQFPKFNITIDNVTMTGNLIIANTTTTALEDMDFADYALYVAITEDNVLNDRGFGEKAVLRKLNPDAAGEPFDQAWVAGDTRTYRADWIYNLNGGNIPSQNIVCVAFIQNKTTKEIYQVATSRDLSIYGSNDEVAEIQKDVEGLVIFPNPASSLFNVRFENVLSEEYNWKLVDVLGRVLQQGTVNAGSTQMQVDTKMLSEGNYFFVLENDKVYTQRQITIVKQP